MEKQKSFFAALVRTAGEEVGGINRAPDGGCSGGAHEIPSVPATRRLSDLSAAEPVPSGI